MDIAKLALYFWFGMLRGFASAGSQVGA
jgi:hypothetical protein